MPFKSKAQQRFMYANKDKLKKQGVDVDEWASKTDFTKLPEKAAGALGTLGKALLGTGLAVGGGMAASNLFGGEAPAGADHTYPDMPATVPHASPPVPEVHTDPDHPIDNLKDPTYEKIDVYQQAPVIPPGGHGEYPKDFAAVSGVHPKIAAVLGKLASGSDVEEDETRVTEHGLQRLYLPYYTPQKFQDEMREHPETHVHRHTDGDYIMSPELTRWARFDNWDGKKTGTPPADVSRPFKK
jgi:hypothetical protein